MVLEQAKQIYALYNPILDQIKFGTTDNINEAKREAEEACGCELQIIHATDHVLDAETHLNEMCLAIELEWVIGRWYKVTPGKAIELISSREYSLDKISSLYKQGTPITQLAKDYGVTRQAIIARLKLFGLHNNYEKTKVTHKKQPIINKPVKEEGYTQAAITKEEQPTLPLKNLKRIEPNIRYNDEWYEVSVFRNGAFTFQYTKDLNKARLMRKGL